MLSRRVLGLPAAAALLFAPVVARAESCDELRTQHADFDRLGRDLTQQNPGIALVALGCLATAASDYQKTRDEGDAVGTFAVCGGLGCNLVTGGYQNCISVGGQIILFGLRVSLIEQHMREQGCYR